MTADNDDKGVVKTSAYEPDGVGQRDSFSQDEIHRLSSINGTVGMTPFAETVKLGEVIEVEDHVHRTLGSRQVSFIAIGGSIGTALFVSIGQGLWRGGAASLLLGWVYYSSVIVAVNNCMAEMAVFMPVTSPFIRMAGKWVDESFGFACGWNFFLYVISPSYPNGLLTRFG